jgi:glycosyltransferase involved in cell wall biosynthesis
VNYEEVHARHVPPFSVLMSVYEKEHPDNLDASLDSVFEQTLRPAEVVLVKDGPLPALLEAVIARQSEGHPEIRVLGLRRNVGLGAALNAGLAHCSHDFVARMDSDDLCTPDRFARQIPLLAADEQLSVVGAWIAEFETDPTRTRDVREVAELPDEVARSARRRCPVNHPTVVFRKASVQSVGGYNAKHLQEDYYLWARLMMAGHRFRNVPAVLVLMRTGEGLYDRRGGLKYARAEIKLFIDFYHMGFVGRLDLLVNVATRLLVRLTPSGLRKCLYQRFARRRAGD